EWIEDFDKEIRKSNRNVLLILDGASSHVTGAVTLTNVEVLKLLPYVTSKIQPIDAGIIASFKTHYRHMQLQCALDLDEARKCDIYKIDQLQAMRWVKQTIDALCIRNPMPIKDLLDLEEEKTEIHQQFNDDDF
ncbi:26413_t:CDS:2, partial [Racocetra persica]